MQIFTDIREARQRCMRCADKSLKFNEAGETEERSTAGTKLYSAMHHAFAAGPQQWHTSVRRIHVFAWLNIDHQAEYDCPI